jgi:hypothetical protein
MFNIVYQMHVGDGSAMHTLLGLAGAGYGKG